MAIDFNDTVKKVCSNLEELHENSGSNCEVYLDKMVETYTLIKVLDEFYDNAMLAIFETLCDMDWAQEYYDHEESESFEIDRFDFNFYVSFWIDEELPSFAFNLMIEYDDDGNERADYNLYREY
jgi:hypothetical protein